MRVAEEESIDRGTVAAAPHCMRNGCLDRDIHQERHHAVEAEGCNSWDNPGCDEDHLDVVVDVA
jgi:hypothetical protein